MEKPENIDAYISLQSSDTKEKLQKIRETIREIIPEAVEIISYSMPAFKYKGKILCYFAAHQNHIGFYATPSANIAFKDELKEYKTSKGAVQFPYTKPIPYDIVEKLIRFKALEIDQSKQKK